MCSALLIATGTPQHGARTRLCPVRHLRSNLALLSAIFIFCICSVGDTLQPKRRGPKPLVDESVLVEWLERERQQGRLPTRDNIISEASRMYNDNVRTDDRPSTTLTLKSMDKYMFNEDESGMFIDFDTGSLKVYVLRGTKTCARRRGYDRHHVTLVACVRADGFYVRPALLWPSALTRGDLFQHEACPISVKATKTGWSSEDIIIEWLREFASLRRATANPHKSVVLIVDGSKTHLTRAIIEEAVKLGVHLVALPSHLTDVVQPLDLSVFKPFKAALKKRQREWRAKNRGKSITPSLFVKFVTESWMQCVTPSVIMSGFRRAGIAPFSPENVLSSLDPCRLAYQAAPPSAAEPAAEPAAEAVLPSLEASPQRVQKVDFQFQATSRAINMATRHDPWNMRLGGFVTSRSFREAAANYEKEQERNKERPAARRQAGCVRPQALPQHQQPRAKRARQDPPPQTTVQWRTQTQNPQPPPPQDVEHSSDSDGDFVPTVYVSYCSSS